jgi:hypothetical protein
MSERFPYSDPRAWIPVTLHAEQIEEGLAFCFSFQKDDGLTYAKWYLASEMDSIELMATEFLRMALEETAISKSNDPEYFETGTLPAGHRPAWRDTLGRES